MSTSIKRGKENYTEICENKRKMLLSQDFAHRPIVFISFNPDAYRKVDGSKVTTCFTITRWGEISIRKPKEADWNGRIAELKSAIEHWMQTIPEKTIEQVMLFYDEMLK